ncbi:MAG: carboxyltransferase domain-containing protein, partial [Candidatus Eremiobacteraeota bacterium]|nr:carboxyltransferase domain-containing protein [Candidatus Eremiobacteraeota bacterium]
MPEYLNAGETALVVEFGRTVDPHLHDEVLSLDAALAAAHLNGVVETVPTYRSLMVHYDPRKLGRGALIERLEALLAA